MCVRESERESASEGSIRAVGMDLCGIGKESCYDRPTYRLKREGEREREREREGERGRGNVNK